MIQDFSSVLEDKQVVNVRALTFRSHTLFRKITGMILTGALVVGVVSCLIYGVLIKSGLKDLALKQSVKLELLKDQQKLYEQRNILMERDQIVLAVAEKGLHSPQKRQVRRLRL